MAKMAKAINLEKAVLIDLALAVNPVKFCQQFFEPDPWQRDLLLSTDSCVLLNCARQSGKSTTAAILALHHAVNIPGALVLVLSPSLRQSGELFKKISGFYQDLGRPVPADAENKHTLELSNKSRIISLPGKEQTVRGFSGVSLLIIDEASQVNDDLYYSVRPMLAVSQGRIILLSTPFGKRGFFFKEWSEGPAWRKVRIPADQCPRISKDFLKQERREIGEWWFAQEYCCEFNDNISSVFSYDEIMGAFDDDVKPFFDKHGNLNL